MLGLTNAAEGAIELGSWEEAEEALHRLEGRELGAENELAREFCEILLQAHRGDVAAARRRLDAMAPRIEAAEQLAMRTWFGRESALVHLLGGDPAPAFEAAIEAVELEPSGVNAHYAAREAARAAVWLRDPDRLRRALEAMAPLRGRWIDAVRRTAESGLAALEGRREDALAGYERALGEWRALDARLDHAFCAADMAHVLPDEELTTEALAESTAFLTGIGAVSLLERIESARPSPAHAEVTGG